MDRVCGGTGPRAFEGFSLRSRQGPGGHVKGKSQIFPVETLLFGQQTVVALIGPSATETAGQSCPMDLWAVHVKGLREDTSILSLE